MIYTRSNYTLILTWNPCEIFDILGVDEIHGLNAHECKLHVNNKDQSYIAGWCNYFPKESYKQGDEMFIYINLSRCTDDVNTTALVFHEVLHRAFEMDHKMDEEEFITWCENETKELVTIIKSIISLVAVDKLI